MAYLYSVVYKIENLSDNKTRLHILRETKFICPKPIRNKKMLVKSDLPLEPSQNSSLGGNVSSSSSLDQNNHSTYVARTADSIHDSDQIGSETTSTDLNSPAQSLHNNHNHNHSNPSHVLNNLIEEPIKSLACSPQQSHQQQQQQQQLNGPSKSETFTVEVNPLSDNDIDDCDCVSIIHFNDCYNIEPSPQSSGAAGFLTAINHLRHLNPMILFSGDILSPSFMSTFTKGEQMIPVLNDIRVDCAVFGNHEFDYGVDNLIEFVKRTTFPWLLSNVIDKETSNQLGDGQIYHIIERSGFKFGIIGLIEEEWLSTLSTLDSSDVIYQDFVERGQELARWLKSSLNVDYVIALTHFRTPNDIRLADSVPEIDLVLGGHDHDYEIIKRPNCHIIKSGTDFREFSRITLKINPNYQRSNSPNKVSDNVEQVKPFLEPDIEHIKCVGYEQDEDLKNKLNKFVTTIDEKMGKVLGQFNCPLDGRFSSIRKYETNLGNFVTDIMLASTHADLAILNSGTLRSDRIHPRGDFTMRDLYNILGYIDPIAVLQATGEHIWRALENGVSQWPKLEGRFPQVSGCAFTFDPSKPAGTRINPSDISIGDESLDLKKHYKLTTKAYLASGKDGYDMLKECKILVPGDESPDLTTSILNHFEAISIVKSNRRTHHRQSIICLSRASLQKILESQNSTCSTTDDMESTFSFSSRSQKPDTTIASHASPLMASNSVSGSLIGKSLPEEVDNNDGNNNDVSMDVSNAADDERTTSSTSVFSAPFSPRAAAAANGTSGRQVEQVQDGASMPTSTPIVGMEVASPSAIKGMAGESASSTPISMVAKPRTNRLMSLYEMEHEQCKLEPKIEGRIRIVGLDEAQYPK